MLHTKPAYYSKVQEDIKLFFYGFYAPLLEEVPVSMKLNAVDSALVSAIKSGAVQYKDGVFSGKFNMRISGELSRFAKFDKRSGTWKGRPGPSVIAASVMAESKRADLQWRLQYAIDQAERNINEAINTLSFGDDLPLSLMRDDIQADLWSVGVKVTIDDNLAAKLRVDYTESQKLNIKNWLPEQTQRLREMVERIQTTGDNSSIRELIESEWHTTAAKARFLARQETSLFFSKLSMERAGAAGVRRYRWSTSHDQRVRPDHKDLQGTIHAIDDPPIVDKRTGRRAHPGEDYNCRCSAIWVLD